MHAEDPRTEGKAAEHEIQVSIGVMIDVDTTWIDR